MHYFRALYSVSLVYWLYASTVCFDYYRFAIWFEIRKSNASSFIILQNCFGLLWYCINLRIVFSLSVKNAIVILTRIALNLQMTFGSMDILTTLFLPLCEHRVSFHLFVSSSVYFINVIIFHVHIYHHFD